MNISNQTGDDKHFGIIIGLNVFGILLVSIVCIVFLIITLERRRIAVDYFRLLPPENYLATALSDYHYVIGSNISLIGSNWIKDALPKYSNPKKYFIYQCPCHRSCGGLGDREKGIVSAYIISLFSNRTFGIHHKCPEDISKWLKPNKINWIIDPNRLIGLSKRTDYLMNKKFSRSLKNLDFVQFYKEDVIYWTENYDCIESLRNHKVVPHLVPWLLHTSTADVYKIVLNILFKPSENFEKRMSTFKQKVVGKKLICAHIRIGAGHEDRFVKKQDMNKVWEILNSSIAEHTNLFIASDSNKIKFEAKNRFPLHFVDFPGPIIHIDLYGAKYPNEGLMKAIFDQLILSHCSTLVISKSGFSYISAFLRQDAQNLYCITRNNVIPYGREVTVYFTG